MTLVTYRLCCFGVDAAIELCRRNGKVVITSDDLVVIGLYFHSGNQRPVVFTGIISPVVLRIQVSARKRVLFHIQIGKYLHRKSGFVCNRGSSDLCHRKKLYL